VDIYIDVLVLENIVMNYLILAMTAKFSKSKTSGFRLFSGALVGASYVIIMLLLPDVKIYYTAFAKIVLSMVIVTVAFAPGKLKDFFKTLAIFYISTFIFAGAAFALLYINQTGGFIRNGMVYVFWETKWTVLFLSIIMVGIIGRIFWEIIQNKFIKQKQLIEVRIVFEEQVIEVAALVDTGNSLYDPLTKMPVVIVEFNAVKTILPSDIQKIFEQSNEEDLDSITGIISNSSWLSRFRLIPFSSLGKENGMLIGFRPDYIEIGGQERKGIKDVIIGIYNRALSKDENYRALLSPELI
jgi:stage II sporulation protein GA (sporulation sigma-E factor processing peptidase)